MEEAPTALRTLRNPLGVFIRVDLDATDVAFQNGLILHRPADDVHIDRLVGELVEASKHRDPLVELLADRCLDLVALLKSNFRSAFPAHAVVDCALAGHDLVIAVVLEAKRVGVCGDFMVPDLLKRGDEVGWRVPCCFGEVAGGERWGGLVPGVEVVEGVRDGVEFADRLRIRGATVHVLVEGWGDGAGKGGCHESGEGEGILHHGSDRNVWWVCSEWK